MDMLMPGREADLHVETQSTPRRSRRRVKVAHDRPADSQDSGLRAEFGRAGPNVFAGYVADCSNFTRRCVVQFFIDGFPVQVAVADQYDASAAQEGFGDGCYGFSFAVAPETLADATIVEVRLANSGGPVGSPICLRDAAPATHEAHGSRGARWVGGLRFCGWLDDPDQAVPKVVALIDGEPVAEAYARLWHQVGGQGDNVRAVPAFDLHLPSRFADGRVRTVCLVDEAGENLPGSPLTFVAFENGLERTLSALGELESERLRGELFDHLIPASLPMSRYADWLERFPPSAPALNADTGSVMVVFAGEGDERFSVESLEGQTCSNWVAAMLPGDAMSFNPAQLGAFLKKQAPDCDVAILAPCGTRLESHAVAALAAACRDDPHAIAVYADVAVSGEGGKSWPVFFSAFDRERMTEQGCGAYLFATRREHLERALRSRPENLFRLFNLLAADSLTGKGTIVHLPGVLGVLPGMDRDASTAVLCAATTEYLGDYSISADVKGRAGTMFPSVRVTRRAEGNVSIIIPTRNRVELLRRCLETIAPAAERVRAEIIVVDNDSSDAGTLEYLASIDGGTVKVMRVPGVFNFSKLNNVAVAAARSDHVCLLNNDIEACDETWLEEMLGRISEPDVGAVGATLLWPSGIIQHAGVVLGPNLGATHAFTDRMHDDCGYGDMLSVARECSAVTGACLLTRKTDYLAVGGMDELLFPVNFNDVDYCLKLRALGRRIIVTPYARLLHLESASRGNDQRPDRAGRLQREIRMLRARWLGAIVDDPYYSPLLSLDSIPFSALAWPPRKLAARINSAAKPAAVPPGM